MVIPKKFSAKLIDQFEKHTICYLGWAWFVLSGELIFAYIRTIIKKKYTVSHSSVYMVESLRAAADTE